MQAAYQQHWSCSDKRRARSLARAPVELRVTTSAAQASSSAAAAVADAAIAALGHRPTDV